jgi:hypothetical protein
MEISAILVVGSSGLLGRGIASQLEGFGRKVVKVSARHILGLSDASLALYLGGIVPTTQPDHRLRPPLGLVIAHRYRGDDTIQALSVEMSITHRLAWILSGMVTHLRVFVMGSVTGALLDLKSPLAYHYAKDLQKSIARQSCRLQNVEMNVIELSWFEKYDPTVQTKEYSSEVSKIKESIGAHNFPGIPEIADFIDNLMRSAMLPRGQIITFDGGYSLKQR